MEYAQQDMSAKDYALGNFPPIGVGGSLQGLAELAKQQAQCQSTTPKESRIIQELRHLDSAVSLLTTAVESLEQELSSVLIPSPACGKAKSSDPNEVVSPLADALRELSARVTSSINRIGVIRERLDLSAH